MYPFAHYVLKQFGLEHKDPKADVRALAGSPVGPDIPELWMGLLSVQISDEDLAEGYIERELGRRFFDLCSREVESLSHALRVSSLTQMYAQVFLNPKVDSLDAVEYMVKDPKGARPHIGNSYLYSSDFGGVDLIYPEEFMGELDTFTDLERWHAQAQSAVVSDHSFRLLSNDDNHKVEAAGVTLTRLTKEEYVRSLPVLEASIWAPVNYLERAAQDLNIDVSSDPFYLYQGHSEVISKQGWHIYVVCDPFYRLTGYSIPEEGAAAPGPTNIAWVETAATQAFRPTSHSRSILQELES